jgi:hypothetical protein
LLKTAKFLFELAYGLQVLGDSMLLEDPIRLEARQAQSLGKLEMREFPLAVKLDQCRFLGLLVEIAQRLPKASLNIRRELEGDCHGVCRSGDNHILVATTDPRQALTPRGRRGRDAMA